MPIVYPSLGLNICFVYLFGLMSVAGNGTVLPMPFVAILGLIAVFLLEIILFGSTSIYYSCYGTGLEAISGEEIS